MATLLRQWSVIAGQLPSNETTGAASDRPPTPPPKDNADWPNHSYARDNVRSPALSNIESYFNPANLSRTNSIYSLSRVSFSNQISQLTSIQLPDASTLAISVSAIPTSTIAAKALSEAALQIRQWIKKSSDVLGGLDAEDDVEWAAAAGREGLGEVDQAIKRFEGLVDIYVTAIERMQDREDIVNLPADSLANVVDNMETILSDWHKVKDTLKGVKEQVEIAMEWEELWNNVLGDIGIEVEALSRLVFEMEEKRHRSATAEEANESQKGLDIDTLETIVGERPRISRQSTASHRYSLSSSFDRSPVVESPMSPGTKEDSNLLALFARMQPLRASLDFLPMRLSVFQSRAQSTFPTACEELETRQGTLETQWKKLESDAEALRRELGEDRWVLVFRNAGRQALKMCASIEKSLTKFREAVEGGGLHKDMPEIANRIESYEAKTMHYGPAIERILAIIERGIKDRLTVNGEILRLQSDMNKRWSELQGEMDSMTFVMERLNTGKSQQLRDSMSTIISSDRSVVSSLAHTPGSSPASSVVLTCTNSTQDPATPPLSSRYRQYSNGNGSSTKPTTARRYSSMPAASVSLSHIPHKTPSSRTGVSHMNARAASPSPSIRSSATMTLPHRPHRESASFLDRPAWNSSTKTSSSISQNATTISKPMPLSYRSMTPTTRNASRAPSRFSYSVSSPPSRVHTLSPLPATHALRPSLSTAVPLSSPLQPKANAQTTLSVHRSPQIPATSPRIASQPTKLNINKTPSTSKSAALKHRASSSNLSTPGASRRQSTIMLPASDLYTTAEASTDRDTPVRPRAARPQSVLGNSIIGSGKRLSMLPRPKSEICSAGERDGSVPGNNAINVTRWYD